MLTKSVNINFFREDLKYSAQSTVPAINMAVYNNAVIMRQGECYETIMRTGIATCYIIAKLIIPTDILLCFGFRP